MVPFTTAWMGENNFDPAPVALYGFVLLMNGVAYYILAQLLIKHHGKESTLARALGSDFKGKLSVICYIIAIVISFFQVWIAGILYVLVALVWLMPDKRIERILHDNES